MISVITATIPPRAILLKAARESVEGQDYEGEVEHVIEPDRGREGPAACRNRAVARARGEWLAFLDDDDYLHPNHLSTLMDAADRTGADVVWPWFEVLGGSDPFPAFFGRQWEPQDPHQIPITALVRRSAFEHVGGFQAVPEGAVDGRGNRAGEDWRLWLDLSAAGYAFYHVAERTWTWRHHGRNTSGLPTRW